MQAYNRKILIESVEENNAQMEHKIANEVFIEMRANGVDFTKLKKCVSCGLCEQRCTQKLNIRERTKWLDSTAERHNYTSELFIKRKRDIILECKDAEKIAIWPASVYATRVLDCWSDKEFETRCEFFNASPAMFGKPYRGKTICSPSQITEMNITVVVLMHYRLQEEIYSYLKEILPGNVRIIRLHNSDDINWFEIELK